MVLGVEFDQMNIQEYWCLFLESKKILVVISVLNEQFKYMNLIDFQPDNRVEFICG